MLERIKKVGMWKLAQTEATELATDFMVIRFIICTFPNIIGTIKSSRMR